MNRFKRIGDLSILQTILLSQTIAQA